MKKRTKKLLFVVLFGAAWVPAQAGDSVAYCRVHRDVDHPDKSMSLPQNLSAAGATDWRCMDGNVLLCQDSANGDSCSKKDPSLTATKDMKEFCVDHPGSDFIMSAITSMSSSTWRCVGTHPAIIKTYRLDRRGYLAAMWPKAGLKNGILLAPNPATFPDPR